jgi:hypothetical protein
MSFALLIPLFLMFVVTNGYIRMLNTILVQHFFCDFQEISVLIICNGFGSFVATKLFDMICSLIKINRLFLIISLVFMECGIIQLYFVYSIKYMIAFFILNGFLLTMLLLCSYSIFKDHISSKDRYFSYLRNSGIIIGLCIVTYASTRYLDIITQLVMISCVVFLFVQKKYNNHNIINNNTSFSLKSLMASGKQNFVVNYIVFVLHEVLWNSYYPFICQSAGFSQNTTLKCMLILQVGRIFFSQVFKLFFPNRLLILSSILTIIILIFWIFFMNKFCLNPSRFNSIYSLYIITFFLSIVTHTRDDADRYGYYNYNIILLQPQILNLFNIASIFSLIIAPISIKIHNIFGIAYILIIVHIFLTIYNIVYQLKFNTINN